MLVLIFPVGLYGLWKNESFQRPTKILITAIIGSIVISNAFIEPLPPPPAPPITRANPQESRVAVDLEGRTQTKLSQTPIAPKNPASSAKPYQIFHRGDFSFSGRDRVEWWITAPEAKTFNDRGRTAMQAAIDLQKESRAHVVSIWLEASPGGAGKGQQLATAMYAPDGGGLSGTQGWKWQIEAADTPGPTTSRRKYPVQ